MYKRKTGKLISENEAKLRAKSVEKRPEISVDVDKRIVTNPFGNALTIIDFRDNRKEKKKTSRFSIRNHKFDRWPPMYARRNERYFSSSSSVFFAPSTQYRFIGIFFFGGPRTRRKVSVLQTIAFFTSHVFIQRVLYVRGVFYAVHIFFSSF